jgi:hypothetical protein
MVALVAILNCMPKCRQERKVSPTRKQIGYLPQHNGIFDCWWKTLLFPRLSDQLSDVFLGHLRSTSPLERTTPIALTAS